MYVCVCVGVGECVCNSRMCVIVCVGRQGESRSERTYLEPCGCVSRVLDRASVVCGGSSLASAVERTRAFLIHVW